MMSDGKGFQGKMSKFITNYGSTATLTPRTFVVGNFGGHQARTVTSGTPVDIKVVPSRNVTNTDGEIIGRLDVGHVNFVIKYDETITKDYLVTYKSKDYTIERIDDVYLQDILVAKRLSTKEDLD
jgi:hypothetical protein